MRRHSASRWAFTRSNPLSFVIPSGLQPKQFRTFVIPSGFSPSNLGRLSFRAGFSREESALQKSGRHPRTLAPPWKSGTSAPRNRTEMNGALAPDRMRSPSMPHRERLITATAEECNKAKRKHRVVQRSSEILPNRNMRTGIVRREQQTTHVNEPKHARSSDPNSQHKRQPNGQFAVSDKERDRRSMRQDDAPKHRNHEWICPTLL
jgi:hypothetical protein